MDRKTLILGFVSFVLLIGFGVVSQFGPQLAIGSAGTVEYQSNSDFWDGEAFLVQWTETGTTETIFADIDWSQVDLPDSISSVNSDVTISAEGTDTEAQYPISQSSDVKDPKDYSTGDLMPIFDYGIYEEDGISSSSDADTHAQNNCDHLPASNRDTPFHVYESDGWFGNDGTIACYSLDGSSTGIDNSAGNLGNVYDLGTPDGRVSTNFEIGIDGQDYTDSIEVGSAVGSSSEFIYYGGQKIGHVEWEGNLATGEAFPEPGNENFLFHIRSSSSDNVDGEEVFIDESKYESYRTWFTQGTAEDRLEDYKNQDGNLDLTQELEEVIGVNGGAAQEISNSRYSQYDFIDDSGSPLWSNEGDFVRVDQGNQFNPQFTFALNAENIVIERTVGIPEIQGIDALNKENGNVVVPSEGTNVDVNIKNVGEAEGQFESEISCQGNFGSSSLVDTTVNDGSTTTHEHSVGFNGSETETSSCTVTATDVADDGTSTYSFDVQGNPDAICNTGEYSKSDDETEILFCQDGTEIIVHETCGEGEKVYVDEKIGQETESGYACGTEDDLDKGWFEKLTDNLGLPSPGGDASYSDECMVAGFVNPGCAIAAGVDGFLNATEDAMALFDVGFGFLVSLVTGGILYVPYRKYVTESSEPAIQVTGAIAVLGFSLLLGFLAFQWIQGLVPKLVIVSLILIYVVIRSIIPGL